MGRMNANEEDFFNTPRIIMPQNRLTIQGAFYRPGAALEDMGIDHG
jgi:hypothetical protein